MLVARAVGFNHIVGTPSNLDFRPSLAFLLNIFLDKESVRDSVLRGLRPATS